MKKLAFIQELHMCLDPTRLPEASWRSGKNITAMLRSLQPDIVAFLGDGHDAGEHERALFASEIARIKALVPTVIGVVGNHEMLRDCMQILTGYGQFDDLVSGVQVTFAAPAVAGQATVTIAESPVSVQIGHTALLAENPGAYPPGNYEFLTVESVNENNKTITFTAPLTNSYKTGSVVKQGESNYHCKVNFRECFRGTYLYDNTTDDNLCHTLEVGNCLFIMLAMNDYHPYYPAGGVNLSAADKTWLEGVVSANHTTKNIFIVMHIGPTPLANVGIYETPTVCYWLTSVRSFFQTFNQTYKIAGWLFGHNHLSWRGTAPDTTPVTTDNAGWGSVAWSHTAFVNLPPTCEAYFYSQPNEGQIVVCELDNGASIVTLKAYSVDSNGVLNSTPFRTITFNLPYTISGV